MPQADVLAMTLKADDISKLERAKVRFDHFENLDGRPILLHDLMTLIGYDDQTTDEFLFNFPFKTMTTTAWGETAPTVWRSDASQTTVITARLFQFCEEKFHGR